MRVKFNPIRMAACLGNPDSQHKLTPHNAGFLWLDRHLARLGTGNCQMSYRRKYKAEMGTDGTGLILLRPLAYMNLSGRSVSDALKRENFGADQLLVVHDEIDLPLGAVRLKFGGGTAGHKGVASIVERLGTREFWRLRLGIGRGASGVSAAEHVLTRFPPQARQLLESAVDRSLTLLPSLRAGDMEDAMKRLHTKYDELSRGAECP